jgi:long-chain fatty acid transport protein
MDASAGGFAVLEQSVRGMGQAFAGSTTGFGDGSSAYYNPAAMTNIDRDYASLGTNLIIPHAGFDDRGSNNPSLGGVPLNGHEGGNGGDLANVPNIYLVKGLLDDDRLKLGFAVNSPFGLSSEWDAGWQGRYHALRSELTLVNLNPSVAFEVNKNLSIGAGISVIYADAELTNAVDFGTIGFSALGPQAAGSLGLVPQGSDGFAKVTGDDWGVGYNLGALFTHGDTQVGFSFRSKVDLTLEGDGAFDVPANATPLTSMGAFTDSAASASVSLPETISLDLHHQVNDRLGLAFGVIWTHWSRLQELRVEFDNPAQSDSVTELDWNTTWRFAGGADFKVNDALTLRGGLSYEETPIESGEFRTPRIPDAERFWITAGATYAITESILFDIGYAHIFFDDAGSANVSESGQTLNGEYDLNIDIVSVSLSIKG